MREKNDEEIHKNTFLRENIQIYIRVKEKQPTMHFLMINHQLVFPILSPSFLLPPFCQISSVCPSRGWSLAFRLHYSPKARPSSIIFLCLSPTLVCLLLSLGPNSFLSPVISSPHLLFFHFSSFLPPKTRPSASPSASPPLPKKTKVQRKLFHMETEILQQPIKGYKKQVCSKKWRIKLNTCQIHLY